MITFLAVSGVLFWLLVIVSIWAVAVAITRGVKQIRADRIAAASIAEQAEQYLRNGGTQ